VRIGGGLVEDAAEEEDHQDQLDQEPEEGGELEKERLVAMAQPVIDGYGNGRDGAPGDVAHGAGDLGIEEEEGDIAQVLDEVVRGDGVEIVEVELVLEVIGSGQEQQQGEPRTEKQQAAVDAGHF